MCVNFKLHNRRRDDEAAYTLVSAVRKALGRQSFETGAPTPIFIHKEIVGVSSSDGIRLLEARKGGFSMPNLLTQHKVRNYDEWRPHFDRHEAIRVAAGITNPRVYRNASDPNDLVLLFMSRMWKEQN